MVIKTFQFLFILTTFLAHFALAGSNSSITYSGRILKPDNSPLEGTAVNFQFTIKSSNNCILWSETQQLNMTGTNGGLSVELGSPTSINLSSGTHNFSNIFDNSLTLGSLTGCDAGSSYTGSLTDDRTISVSFNDGTGPNLIPAIAIKAVPFSNYAKVADSARTLQYLIGVPLDTVTPTNGQVLRFNGLTGKWEASNASGGSGTVTQVGLSASSLFAVSGGPVSTYGTFNLSMASVASGNQILASPDGIGGLPSFRNILPNDIPSLSTSKITSGTLSAAVGGTGLVPTAGDANKIYAVNSAGTGTEFKILAAGSGININSGTPGIITISSAGGSVSQIDSGAGLTGGPITGAGTLSLSSSGVLAGSYGGISNYTPSFTVDTYGRLTSAGSIQISINANQITAGTLNLAQIGNVPLSSLPAQSSNTPNTLALRDSNGNFALGTLSVDGLSLKGAGTIGISAPATANYSFVLPANIGTAGQVLTTNGTNATSWTSIAATQWTNVSNGVNYASGSVGVGSASPAAKLDIAGGVRIANDADSCAPGKAGTIRYASSSIQFCNGTSWGTLGVAGAGITNLNGMTGGAQTFGPLTYVGTSGTISSSADVHTLNIPLATTGAAVAGLISNADYLRFNSKLDASLGTGSLWMGQAGVATQVSVSGDASLSSLGTLTLASSGVLAGSYPRVTVDAKGRVTSAGTLNVADIPSIDYLLPSQTGNAGKILSSNGTVSAWTNPAATGVTSVVAGAGLSGGTISSTGTLSLATTTVAAGSFGSANFIPTFIVDAYGRLTGAGSVAVAATADLSTIAGTLGVAKGGTGLNAATAANGQLLVGNGSGFTLGTLNSSTGIVVTNTAGTINVGTNAQTTNAVNTLMMRDGIGGFAAGTATLQGLTLQGFGTVSISTPLTANYSMILPANIGTPGQVLTTNGTNNLAWTTVATGGTSQWTSISNGIHYSSGSVGIGTTNPSKKLEVLGLGDIGILVTGLTGDPGYWAYKQDSVITNKFWGILNTGFSDIASNRLSFGNNSTASYGGFQEKLVITNGGSVGIGTNSPVSMLDVNGEVRSTGSRLVGVGTARILPPSSGNYDLTLPSTPGTSGQVLSTAGTSGILSWITAGAGSGDFMKDGSVAMTGALRGTFGTAAAPAYTFFGDTGTGIYRPGSGSIAIATAGTSRFVIDQLGRVGIGTNSPLTTFQVGDENLTATPSQIYSSDIPSSGRPTIMGNWNSSGYWGIGPATGAGDNLLRIGNVVGANNDWEAIQDTSLVIGGSLGIGTNSPNAPLDVRLAPVTATSGYFSAQYLRATLSPSAAGGSTNADGLSVESFFTSANDSPSGTINGINATTYTSGARIYTSNAIRATAQPSAAVNEAAGVRSRVLSSAAGTNITDGFAGHFSITRSAGAITNGYGVYIDGIQATNKWSVFASDATAPSYFAGSIGIGTTSPASKLEVFGNIRSSASGTAAGQSGQLILSELVANGTNSVAFRAPDSVTQNVTMTLPGTIGTSGQVLSTDGAGILSWITAGTGNGDFMKDGSVAMTGALRGTFGTAALPGYSFSGDTGTGIARLGAGSLAFSTAGTARVSIDQNGNVGIGTAAPTQTLDIWANDAGATSGDLVLKTTVSPGLTLGRLSSTSSTIPSFLMQDRIGGQIVSINPEHTFAGSNGPSATFRARMGLGGTPSVTSDSLLTVFGRTTFGSGDLSSTPSSGTIGAARATGLNINGSNLVIQAGLATGNASSGNILFQGSIPAGSSSTLQTEATLMTILSGGTSAGRVGIGTTSPAALLDVAGATRSTSQILVGSGTMSWLAPTAGNYSLTLPTTPGTSGQVLSTAGTTGALSWVTAPINGGTFLAGDGSATAPGYAFNSNGSMGMYVVGVNQMGFSTKGVQRMTIDDVGMITMNNTLQTNNFYARAIGVQDVYASSYTATGPTPAPSSIPSFFVNNQSLTDNSFVTSRLMVTNTAGNSQSSYLGAVANSAGFTPTIVLGQQTGSASYAERLRIDTNGNLGLGTTAVSLGSRFEVYGGAITAGPKGASAGQGGEIRMSGLLANGTNSVAFRAPDSISQNVTMTLPATIGTANQYLKTDGVGQLSWGSPGLTNFIESLNSTAPNVSTPVASLSVTNAATNVELSLVPKGSGALTAAIADNTATGGNKRGIYAVDLQLNRSVNTQVASGSYSSISGGSGNTASGSASSVGGGSSNTASSTGASVIGGSSNTSSGNYSTSSGLNAIASGFASFASGYASNATGPYSVVSGGFGNTASGNMAMIPGGTSSQASGWHSIAAGTFLKSESYSQATFGAYNVITGGGTSSWVPTDPIFVVGNGSLDTARSNAMTILKNGNVGIGTTSPINRIHLQADSIEATQLIQTGLANSYASIRLRTPSRNYVVQNSAADSDQFRIYDETVSTSRLVISSAGSVGIGTTGPARLLHVNGPMRVTASALPGTGLAAGDIAVDSGDANKLKWYDGSAWQAAGGSGGGGYAGTVDITVASYSITSGQNGIYFTFNHSAAGTINLPALSGLSDGFQVTILRQVANALTLTPNGADTFPSGITTIEMQGQNMASVTLTKLGSKWNLTNTTDDCIVGQSCWATNQIYVGTYNGKQYFTTPGGCTDSGTPTCAGGTDTVTKAWATAAPEWNTLIGMSNYKDGQTQSASLATYATANAAKYCENMTYAGYSDWYLPANKELSFLYQKSENISGFVYSGNYWSSTEFNTASAWNFYFGAGGLSNISKTNAVYVRCLRRF